MSPATFPNSRLGSTRTAAAEGLKIARSSLRSPIERAAQQGLSPLTAAPPHRRHRQAPPPPPRSAAAGQHDGRPGRCCWQVLVHL